MWDERCRLALILCLPAFFPNTCRSAKVASFSKVSHYETARSASQQTIYQPKHNFAVRESAFVGDVRINLSTNSLSRTAETFAFSWTEKFWSLRCNNEVEWFAVFRARGCRNRVVDLFCALRWENRVSKVNCRILNKEEEKFRLPVKNFHFAVNIL